MTRDRPAASRRGPASVGGILSDDTPGDDAPGDPTTEARLPPLDPRLLRHARHTRRFLVVAAVLGLGLAVAIVAQANLLAGVITDAFLHGGDLAGLQGALAALAGVVAVRALLVWASDVAAHRAAAGVRGQLRRALLARVAEEGPVALGQRSRGGLAVAATRGLEALDGYFSRYLPQLVLALVVPAVAIVWIWPRDRLSVIILLITLPLIPLFMALIGLLANQRVARQWSTLQALGGHFLDVLGGLTTLKTLGAADRQQRRVREITDRFRDATMRTLRIAFLSAGWLELMATIGTAMIAVGVGLRLVEGTLDLQTGLAVLILAPEVYLPVRAVGQQFHASMEGMEAAREVLDVIEATDATAHDRAATGAGGTTTAAGSASPGAVGAAGVAGAAIGGRAGPVAATPRAGTTAIRLRDVDHDYRGRDAPVLRGLDLTIRPGERLTVLGPTGAGKSTLLTLLLGFDTPTGGTLTVDLPDGGTSVALADLDPAAWRAGLAWVPQRPHLVTGTVAENVRLGRPDADDATVADAVARAGLDEVVARLPGGLAHPVGEGGAHLSAGQRRRVALARALVREPSLLLLDEPTADLDPINAGRLARTLDALDRSVTLVAVTHRLALAEQADRVVVLAGGRVVEQGAPDALAAVDGWYRDLRRGTAAAARRGGWAT